MQLTSQPSKASTVDRIPRMTDLPSPVPICTRCPLIFSAAVVEVIMSYVSLTSDHQVLASPGTSSPSMHMMVKT